MKNLSKIFPLSFLSLLFLLSSSSGIYALTQIQDSGQIDAGYVDVEIEENARKNDSLFYHSSPIPSSILSIPATVTNKGNECWIRLQLSFDCPYLDPMDEDLYENLDENWRLQDGWLYYMKPLMIEESATPFDGIRIPSDIPQELAGTEVTYTVKVDALQSANITPDFESTHPWGDIVIQKYEKEDNVTTREVEQYSKTFKVDYNGDTKTLMTNETDFMLNIPALMPGDTYTNTAKFKNNSNFTREIYFQSEEVESEFLEWMTLRIQSGDEVLYEGTVSNEDLAKGVLLTTLEPGEEKEVLFTLTASPEMDNAWTLSQAPVHWQFYTDDVTKDEEPDDEVPPTPTDTDKDTDTNKDTQKPNGTKDSSVNTGVWFGVLGASGIGVVGSIGGLGYFFCKGKKKEE